MKFDRDRAARILVDAAEMGDGKAAEKWKVTTRTLRNYRAALGTDRELSSTFHVHAKAAEASWHCERVSVLKAAAMRAKVLLEIETDLDKVSRVVEKFGDLDLAASVLDVRSPVDPEGRATPEASGSGTLREREAPSGIPEHTAH